MVVSKTMKKKRIYKNKNYWIREADKESMKLPSEKLRELIKYDSWPTLQKEIPILKKIVDKLFKGNYEKETY